MDLAKLIKPNQPTNNFVFLFLSFFLFSFFLSFFLSYECELYIHQFTSSLALSTNQYNYEWFLQPQAYVNNHIILTRTMQRLIYYTVLRNWSVVAKDRILRYHFVLIELAFTP